MRMKARALRVKPATSIVCLLSFVAAVLVSGTPFAADNTPEPGPHADVDMGAARIHEPIQPVPVSHSFDAQKIALGKKLFHDRRLAGNRRLACADCHNLDIGGTDKLAFSLKGNGEATQFNTPTIFNVSLNTQYYWSGKFLTLEDQIDDALKEIDTTWPALIRTINAIPDYVDRFNALYADGITAENIQDTIVHFEQSLLTPNSDFDRYLNGDHSALSGNALRGYRLFKSYGCITCHQGKNVGGNFLLDVDKTGPPFGKLSATRDRLKNKLKYIRVPSLRNVAVTAPYFHDGSATTLYQAVQRMIDEYLGINAKDEEIYYIISFLNSLTGEYKGKKL
jgi:cytochrome c peroxidase